MKTYNEPRIFTTIVLIITLSQRTTGGSWRNLERKFIHEQPKSTHWNENRVIFPNSEEDSSEYSWRPEMTPRTEEEREKCITSCPTSIEWDPVCGTNDVTYQNMAQLHCQMICGVAVDLHKPSACKTEAVTTNPVFKTTTSVPITSSVSNVEMEWCIKQCPTTPEYNPVCGSNLVTYSNVGKLECAKYCGVDVALFRQSPCPSQIPITTTIAPTTSTTNEELINNCINNCPATPQYDPVCGTDNVTYNNVGRLECARGCGVDVNVRHRWPCHISSTEQTSSSEEEDYSDEINPRHNNPKSRLLFSK